MVSFGNADDPLENLEEALGNRLQWKYTGFVDSLGLTLDTCIRDEADCLQPNAIQNSGDLSTNVYYNVNWK